MRIKPLAPDIDDFDPASEQAGDKDLALRLTQLFRNLEHGTVAIFDGRWGVGKTTFVRRWLAHLKREGVPSIYLDAFAVDYLESPFVAIAGAFAKAGEDANKERDPAYRAFVSAAAKVGKAVGGSAAKIGVKAITLGLVGAAEINELDALKDTIADAFGEQADNSVRELIEAHAQKDGQLASLREKLASFSKTLGTPAEEASPAMPLIVVIDELDRCRPDFALGMVETIKHFFGADNVHFVLVTNREHLVLSVKHRYGSFKSADEYLRKFYDFQIVYEQNYTEHDSFLIQHRVNELSETLLGSTPERQEVARYVIAAALAHRLTLRDLENVFSNLSLAYAAVGTRNYRPSVLIAFLALLKTIDPSMYSAAKSGSLSYNELSARIFGVDNWGQLNVDRLKHMFQYYMDPNINTNAEEWRGFGQDLWNFSLERTRVIQYLCNAVIDRFAPAQA